MAPLSVVLTVRKGLSPRVLWLPLLLMIAGGASAEPTVLRDISYAPVGGNEVQVILELSGPVPSPNTFATDNPARVVVDLPDTRLDLKQKNLSLGVGRARTLHAVESGGRCRIVIGLTQSVPYVVNADGNRVVINLDGGVIRAASKAGESAAATSATAGMNSVEEVDFRRGENGEARIIVRVSRPDVVVDMQERGNHIYVDFLNSVVPERLERRLDVTDFATPVTTIETYSLDSQARLVITPTGRYEFLAYQTGSTYIIEVKPVEEKKRDGVVGQDREYTGERLSFNFQNIEIRAVLQLIADFTGLNIVASDSVRGNITLRLKNVPWDQALDIILKARGLGMRQIGNVLLIAPNEEIAARDKQELEAQQQLQQLVPLRTQFFPINYAKAGDVSAMLGAEGAGVISDRGSVSVDPRTNTLMVKDTPDRLEEIAKLIEKLDVPIRQVLIESRIVIANDDFSRQLGVRSGLTTFAENGADGVIATSGSSIGTDTMVNSAIGNLGSTGNITPIALPALGNRLNVDLPAASSAGSLALAILGADYLVDLELSALQQEGRGEVISSPRVVTSNQKQATIEQGVEIPYQEASASGATSVSFKKAVLSLQVTPQITPDDRVIMDLNVTKDAQGKIVSGIPTINTRAVKTQVLVDNGATVVLGGIYEQTRREDISKVPLLGDLPVVGNLFRQTVSQDDKAELLIFVTPKILKEQLSTGL